MSDSAACSSVQHPIKKEFTYEEQCFIKSDIKQEYEDLEENKEDDINTKYEEFTTSDIKLENTVYEGVLDFSNTAVCNANYVLSGRVKCWICETDSCEHLRFANFTTVKEEPVDDAIQLEQQLNKNEVLGDNNNMAPAGVVAHPVMQTKKYFYCSHCDYKSDRNQLLQNHIRAKHTGEYLFSCSECDYKCNRKNSLQRHNFSKHLIF